MNDSQKNDKRKWNLWKRSVSVRQDRGQASHFHMLDADICLPTDVDLLRQRLPASDLKKIYNLIGAEKLRKIASVTHGNPESMHWKGGDPRWKIIGKREGKDLKTIRTAITEATEKQRP